MFTLAGEENEKFGPTVKEMAEIENQTCVYEKSFLISLMLGSDDENIRLLLEEVMMVAKLVHEDEFNKASRDFKTKLILDQAMANKLQYG